MDSIIDSALASAAGTLAKDLEPAAVATLQDLKAFVHGQADRLRTALPTLEQTALTHVRAISNAVLAEYDNVLERIDSHLTGATPNVPSASNVPAGPVDPTSGVTSSAPSLPMVTGSSEPSSAPSENSGATSSATTPTDTPAV